MYYKAKYECPNGHIKIFEEKKHFNPDICYEGECKVDKEEVRNGQKMTIRSGQPMKKIGEVEIKKCIKNRWCFRTGK